MTKRSFNSIKKDGRTRKWITWAVDCPGPGCIFIVKTKYFVYLRVKWRICASKALYANLNTCNLGYLILPLKGPTFCLTLTHFCEIKYRPFGRYTPTTYWIWRSQLCINNSGKPLHPSGAARTFHCQSP